MERKTIKADKYLKLLNRLGKHFSPQIGLLLVVRSYINNNIYYYLFCLLFRALYLIMISGNYMNIFLHINCQKIQNSSKIFTLHYLFEKFKFNYRDYLKICSVLYLLFLIRLLLIIYMLIQFSSYKNTNAIPIPFKYQVIIEHILFLFFPYLLEFLAMPYYIYFSKNYFLTKFENINKAKTIILMCINTILIIIYNFQNYIYLICSNKNYTYNYSEAILGTQNEKVFEKSFISYRDTKLSLICFIIFQNIAIIQNIEKYIGDNYVKYYKGAISIVMILLIIIIIREKLYLYNYINLINSLIAVFIIFCFFSIILDILFYLTKYELNNLLSELIYIIEKILLSYISYLLIIYIRNKHLQKKILKILFQEKNKNNINDFINAFLYLNQIMMKIKEKNNHNEKILLINFLNLHIKKCEKPECNCKLFSSILSKEEKNYSYLLIALNYLHESAFLEFDYYNNYDLTILLAEHYCHLVNNPILAFSFVISLLIRQKNRLTPMQKIVLYELCEKYIYSIFVEIRMDENKEIKDENLLINKQKLKYFQNYFISLKTYYYTKILMNKYIKILIKILKYKNIFEDTLTINYDEGNETIKNVQINFFNLNSNMNSSINYSKYKNKKKINGKKDNYNPENISYIYKVIKILKKEQLCNKSIIDSINNINIDKDIPIFIIYKYYLFFDLFKDEEIPIEIMIKLNSFLSRYKTINNKRISKDIYTLLKRLYEIQNNSPDSKFFAIFQFKEEIKTKYFDEYLSLKLGYKQKDIINEKIEEFMPKDVYNSHQNMVKRFIIGEQQRFFRNPKYHVFDASHTVMACVESHGVMIYNLSKYLNVIFEIKLIDEKNYVFMLNHNFDLIAITKNFTYDYLLNQKIFNKYKLNFLEILKTKPEKITQKFSEIFKKLEYQKEFRQIKTDEYLLPQIYLPSGEKNKGMFQKNNFNINKNKLLAKISNLNNDNNIGSMVEENEKLIKNEKNKEEIFETLLKNGEYIIRKKFGFNLNKMKFIENIDKELTKILDNQLINDTNKEQNLVISAKSLINDSLKRKELRNNYLNIEVVMTYIYDRPFYFISIDDENKFKLKLDKYISITNRKMNQIVSSSNNYFNQGSNKVCNKPLNSNNLIKVPENDENHSINSSINFESRKKIITSLNDNTKQFEFLDLLGQTKKEVLEKIDKYRTKINQDNFILIIKLLLFILIIGILIIYILNLTLQRKSINMIERILLAFYDNAKTKNILSNIHSKLIGHLQDLSNITTKIISSSYSDSILNYAKELRQYFHLFKKAYIGYNLEMKKSLPIIYQSKKFYKLRGKWREILYDSDYCSELDFLIHSIFSIDFENIEDIQKDINIFLFYQNRTDREEKISNSFIKLVFYFSVNYDDIYKQTFDDINYEIYSSYSYYSKKGTLTNYGFEISSLIFYSLFFTCCFIYLHYANIIIIKNIIFLFLDFSQDHEDNNTHTNNASDIIVKLMNFQNLLNDFNLTNVKTYSDFLDKKNKNALFDNKETKIEIKKTESLIDIKTSQTNDIKTKKSNNSSQNIFLGTKSRFSVMNINYGFKKTEIKQNNNNVNNSNSSLKGLNYKDIKKSPSINQSNNVRLKKESQIEKIPKHNNSMIQINDSFLSDSHLKNNYIDAVLDKSNKITISIIKIHFTIIIFFMILLIFFSFYKIRNNTIFIGQYGRFYSDFNIVDERYSSLYYFWNTLKTLIIFDYKDKRWNKKKILLENMNSHYEKITNDYNQLLIKNRDFYNEVNKLFEIFTYNKKDSIEYLKDNICNNESICYNYIVTNDSIFKSGFDTAFKISFSYINNIFLDYQSIKNKTSKQEIINTITGDSFYEYRRMKQSMANVFYFLKERIFQDFKTEAISFGIRYKRDVLTLNIISLILSILILLFVNFYIFITVSNFSKPIKDSSHRINRSFYYIKNYRYTK